MYIVAFTLYFQNGHYRCKTSISRLLEVLSFVYNYFKGRVGIICCTILPLDTQLLLKVYTNFDINAFSVQNPARNSTMH